MASSVTSAPPTPTPPAPPASSTSASGGGGGGGGGGPTSSPLLFFVALGFGVVFTNLWIIVGVKYCFRYNQRNRRPVHDDNGDPIDMVAMPHGPRRRRREKKLMTMDEVNERFPLMKYKQWMTNRAEEGLPTAGGVAAPSASRAASLRNAEGVTGRKSGESQRPTTPAAKQSTDQTGESPETKKEEEQPKSKDESKPDQPDQPDRSESQAEATDQTSKNHLTPARTNDTGEDLDDDDQIQMAVPTEMMAVPGDSCAICIDTLEDDDDVRGLTCGHAFHASCLDPWLTSRKACCPLCKADYYVPKPRPEGEQAGDGRQGGRGHGQRTDVPNPPQDAYVVDGQRRPRFWNPRLMFLHNDAEARARYGIPDRANRRDTNRDRPSATATTSAPPTNNATEEQASGVRRFVPNISLPRPHIRAPNFMRRNQTQPSGTTTETAAPTSTTTPGQLEAGQHP